ncbi:hypothetical protein N9L68_01020 [bacterium]|nr:hypothetical protein [bacterium]
MDSWDEEKVKQIMDEGMKMTEYHKKRTKEGNGTKYATSTLLVVDDMASEYHILHANGSSLLNSMFIKIRHQNQSIWVASQRPSLVSSTIRTQMSALFIFKQRNVKDLITFLDEFSAMVDKKTLMELYKTATEQKYNFLYINHLAGDADHMFYWNLDKRFTVSDMDQT